MAKCVFLHPIRAMDCAGNGGYGNIIAGLEWVGKNHVSPAVVSMSITMPQSTSMDTAVANLVRESGVVAVRGAQMGCFRAQSVG